jgi:predicted Zn-dependent peptidase
VVTEAMPGVRSLALGILVEASPQDELPHQSGLAHLTEHMIFQGTSNRNARQIAELMDLAGGQIGGFTTRDYTGYFAHVLDEHGPYALDLLGDLFLNPIIPPERLQREQEAILREIASGHDSPSTRAHELLKSTAWRGHPLGRPIAGTPEDVRALTREDVIYFFHANYLPDRMVIAAAGNVEHEDFVAQARDGFWRLLGQSGRCPRHPPLHQAGVALAHAPLSQAYFAIGMPACTYAHPSRYAMHVFNSLLGGGISSRLYRRLREERGLVYDIGSEYQAYRDAGMLVIEGCTAPEHLCDVILLVLLEVGLLVTGMNPANEEEVWKAKTQVRRQHLLAGESASNRMSWLATQEMYFDMHVPAEEVLARIEEIDGPLLHTFMNDYLSPALSQTTIAVVGPEASAHYDQASLNEVLASFRQGLTMPAREADKDQEISNRPI